MKTGEYFHRHCNALRMLDVYLLFSLWVIAILDHPAQLTPPLVIWFGHIHFLASLASTENIANTEKNINFWKNMQLCKFREYALHIMYVMQPPFFEQLFPNSEPGYV